ncbi:MAG: hypothetical protein HYU51_15930 [Candidatus Rokubacteria bacterium]|nr:hypothetical protein [Candidatus Rokubacteria bacterium]
MTVAALVADLRRRGVTLEPRGDKLAVRPVSRVRPDELEELRARKPEVLALLAPAPEPVPVLPSLDPVTVREALGDKPDPHAVAMIAWDVLSAVRALEREIQSGVMAPGPRRVAGRPLGDWLDLDDVARLLRAWRDRSFDGRA